MGKGYSDDAYKEIVYKHPNWTKVATDYEAGFSAKLSNDPIVKEAAHGVLTKLSKMLNSYYNVQKFKKEHPAEYANGDLTALVDLAQNNLGVTGEVKAGSILEDALLTQRENRGSAGQIGNKVQELSEEDKQDEGKVAEAHAANQEMLDAVINEDGNLREQMTLLYNGFFQNGGRSKEQINKSVSFKNMMSHITADDITLMRYQGLEVGDNDALSITPDLDIITAQNAYKNGGDIMDTQQVARNVAKAQEKKKGKGNVISRFFRGISRWFSSTNLRRKVVNKKGFGKAYYDRLGLNLSAREAAYSMKNGELQWQEGGRLFEMPKKVDAMGMLKVAGTSGTSLRMLAAYRMLGADKKDLLYFRLALIGWMCSSRDHSLYEVLKGSHNAGVKGYEDLSDAITMYQTVDPIAPAEIREKYAPNREYPHETLYKQMVQEVTEARMTADEEHEMEIAAETGFDFKAKKAKLMELANLKQQRDNECNLLKSEKDSITIEETKLRMQAQDLQDKISHAPSDVEVKKLRSKLEAVNSELASKETLHAELEGKVNALSDEIKGYNKAFNSAKSEFESYGHNTSFLKNTYRLYSDTIVPKNENIDSGTENLNAQDLALNIYTTEAFKVINQSQKYNETIARYIMKRSRTSAGFLNATRREMMDDALLDKILVTLRLSNRIAQDAIIERSSESVEDYSERIRNRGLDDKDAESEARAGNAHHNAGKVTTLRGGKTPSEVFKGAGSVYTTKSLTSTSRSIFAAQGFYAGAAPDADNSLPEFNQKQYDNASILQFNLTGKSGLDIDTISRYDGEQEILIPTGVRFKVIEPLHEVIINNRGDIKKTEEYDPEIVARLQDRESERDRSLQMYRLRKYAVLEEIDAPRPKYVTEKYEKQRQSRDDKRRRLEERVRAFEALRERRRLRASGQ